MSVRAQDIKSHLTKQFSFSPEQVDMMLPSFISTLAGHMVNLENAVQSKNPIQLGRAAHTLKGALLNLGLSDCATIALEIEKNGKQDNAEFDYESHFNELRERIGELV